MRDQQVIIPQSCLLLAAELEELAGRIRGRLAEPRQAEENAASEAEGNEAVERIQPVFERLVEAVNGLQAVPDSGAPEPEIREAVGPVCNVVQELFGLRGELLRVYRLDDDLLRLGIRLLINIIEEALEKLAFLGERFALACLEPEKYVTADQPVLELFLDLDTCRSLAPFQAWLQLEKQSGAAGGLSGRKSGLGSFALGWLLGDWLDLFGEN